MNAVMSNVASCLAADRIYYLDRILGSTAGKLRFTQGWQGVRYHQSVWDRPVKMSCIRRLERRGRR